MTASDFTSRMSALLARLRREMNGAVAGAMRVRGSAYGLNYGVSLPTIRTIARAAVPDHDFARYLYLQDVRELRLAALHMAEPGRVTPDEFGAWAAGIVNSEVAEEAAFALLSRMPALRELYAAWMDARQPLWCYAALLAAARSRVLPAEEALGPLCGLVAELPDNSLIAAGAVALLASEAETPEREAVRRTIDALPQNPTAARIREEMAWRLEG